MSEIKTDTKTASKKSPEWIAPQEGVFDVYANSAHLTWSLDDVRVRFAQLVNSPDTPNPGADFASVAEERVAVTFSWRNAVIFRNGLSKLIESYEKVNGPVKVDIKLPPSMNFD
jgi:hypothetical protein